MSNLRETQHKRVVMLAESTIVFCLFSLWQLSSRIFEVGYSAGFEFTNREIYLFSSCTLIFMTVIVLLVRSFQDNAAIRYFEYHDKQTGLPNRANVIQTLNRHMREGDSNGLFVMIDLGRLKSINNSMGSEVGDQVLAAYGNRLSYFFESPNRSSSCMPARSVSFCRKSVPKRLPENWAWNCRKRWQSPWKWMAGRCS